MPAAPEAGGRFTYSGFERFADGRIFNPTCLRNNPPMVAQLARLIGNRSGPVLEIGAGTGQHAAAFSLAFPELDWWPSDPDALHRRSIAAWARELRAPEREPLALDAEQAWDEDPKVRALGPLTAVLAMNVIHIAPWSVAQGIVAGASRALGPDGLLVLYGPFHQGGGATGPGNAAFDSDLRSRNPAWGIRDVEDVAAVARGHGFSGPDLIRMPADNRTLAFRRPG